jgi:two-component system, cell cycle response regulator
VGVEAERGAAQAAPKVLVVDDSPTISKHIGSMLERAGYRVETAPSGEVAFQRCFDEHFDAVVSDITMGALSGVQLCRLLTSDPITKDIPVVLLTAADDPRSRFWGRNAGAAAYVAKERARQDLLTELSRVLAAAHPGHAAALRTRGGRRAQPMERLSQVLDGELFRAVVSSEVRRLIHHTTDREQFCEQFLRMAAEVSDYSYLTLSLNSPGDVSCAVHARAPWPVQPDPRTLEAFELSPEAASRMKVVHDEPLSPEPDRGIEVRDKVRFPIEAAGEKLGTLVAIGRDKRLGGDDRNTLDLVARELGILVKNLFLLEETRRLANNDGLTGLPNRRRASERLEIELSRSRRYRNPMAVALCDVDHFKHVNDQFGHNMGDEVLVHVARALSASLRQVDLVGRWGGEEFLVILPETDVAGARIVGERLRKSVETLPPFKDGPDKLTCSVGVAVFAGDTNTAGFVDRADQALYRAKRSGRNRVEHAE